MKGNIFYKTIFLGVMLTSFLSFCYANKSKKLETTQIIFPRSVAVNISQVGWMDGSSLDQKYCIPHYKWKKHTGERGTISLEY